MISRFNVTMLSAALATSAMLSACAGTSSGVVPIGKDTYMVSVQGGLHAAEGTLRADAFRQANAYCEKDGKSVMPVSTVSRPQGMWTYAEAEVRFMCLAAGDPALGRPRLEPAPNVIIQDQRR